MRTASSMMRFLVFLGSVLLVSSAMAKDHLPRLWCGRTPGQPWCASLSASSRRLLRSETGAAI